MTQLTGKVAIVSGGARGMGAAYARAIVREGGSVIIGDVLDNEGKDLAQELGNRAEFVHLDVTSTDDWAEIVRVAVETFGKLTTLINNAGILTMGSVDDTSAEDWNRIIGINLTGQFLGVKAALPYLEASAPASIVNVSSTAGFKGFAGLHGYAASKFGVRGLTKSLALELAPKQIRVNSVHPGSVRTAMTDGLNSEQLNPMKRFGEVDEIASLIVYLASDASSFSTGSEFIADGGELAGSQALDSNS
ncbi:3-alpha-hydroxysteroid dehydrogenase [Rhodococcus sp. SC4]|nr:3-alpha-hydroxysteroid dehydrogenase [Rhodococcus sp. SC4]RZL84846.1 MAG: SDR family oxidoreductase [Rhodococcus sp. (in: high G+C Gram-positive bacteria)]